MSDMDQLDGVLTLDNLVLVTEAIKPYVLAMQLDPASLEEAEGTVLAAMKREAGVLLILPTGFLPDEDLEEGATGQDDLVFGPHQPLTVAAVIEDGGVVQPTGTFIGCIAVDCSTDVLRSMKHAGFSGIRRGHIWFRRRFTICFPFSRCVAPHATGLDCTVLGCKSWVLHPRRGRAQAGHSSGHTKASQKKACAKKGYSFRRWCNAKAKESYNRQSGNRGEGAHGHLAADGCRLEEDWREAGSLGIPCSSTRTKATTIALESLIGPSNWEPAIGCSLGKISSSTSEDCDENQPWFVGFAWRDKTLDLEALEDEKLVPDQTSSLTLTSGDSLARAVLAQSQALTTLVQQIASVHSDPMSDLAGTGSGGGTRGASARAKLQMELAQRKLLPVGDAVHVKENGSYKLVQCHCRGAPESRCEWCQIPGALRWVQSMPGAGPVAISGDADLRLHDGRQHVGCNGWSGIAGCDNRASLLGRRQDGLGNTFVLSGRPTSCNLCEQAALLDIKGKGICTTCRPEVGLAFLKELEVINTKRVEMTGGGRPSGPSSGDTPQPNPKPKAKSKRKGKGKGRGGRRVSTMNGRAAEAVGPEPNPLTSEMEFHRWAICLPRMILGCHCKFAWQLKTSFSAIWRDEPLSPTTIFPLPAPHPGCFDGSGPGLSKKFWQRRDCCM